VARTHAYRRGGIGCDIQEPGGRCVSVHRGRGLVWHNGRPGDESHGDRRDRRRGPGHHRPALPRPHVVHRGPRAVPSTQLRTSRPRPRPGDTPEAASGRPGASNAHSRRAPSVLSGSPSHRERTPHRPGWLGPRREHLFATRWPPLTTDSRWRVRRGSRQLPPVSVVAAWRLDRRVRGRPAVPDALKVLLPGKVIFARWWSGSVSTGFDSRHWGQLRPATAA
jgi:hypothetical protein